MYFVQCTPIFVNNIQCIPQGYTQVHFNVTTVLQPPQGLLFDRGFLRNYCIDLDALWCQIRVWSQAAKHQRADKFKLLPRI